MFDDIDREADSSLTWSVAYRRIKRSTNDSNIICRLRLCQTLDMRQMSER